MRMNHPEEDGIMTQTAVSGTAQALRAVVLLIVVWAAWGAFYFLRAPELGAFGRDPLH